MPIAFDAASNGAEVNPGTSVTWSHTCSGSNRILFVLTRGGAGEGDLITGVTYNGVSLTKIASAIKPSEISYVSLYYLIGPATGANNVVVTLSSGYMQTCSVSYTGAKQSNQPDAYTTDTIENNPSNTTTLTTVADNCWTVLASRGGGVTAGTNTTQRATNGSNTGMFDSNGAITPPGSTNLQVTGGDSQSDYAAVMASFSPNIARNRGVIIA